MSNLKASIQAAQIDLIKELGIDTLEPKQKEELLLQIGEILQQRIVLRIVEELPEEKQDEFKGILEKAQDNPDLLDQYLKENIPGVEEMILAEIGEYKQGASDFMKQSLVQADDEGKEDASKEVAAATDIPAIEVETEKPVIETVPEVSVEESAEVEAGLKPEVSTENLVTAEVEEKAVNRLEETEEMKALRENIEKIKTEEATAGENLIEVVKPENEAEKKEEVEVPKKEIEMEVSKKEIEAEKPSSENLKVAEVDEMSEISKENDDLAKLDDQSDFRIGAKPIEKVQTESDVSIEKTQAVEAPVVSTGIEQEQADQEAQILEENKIDNKQVAGEELDLSNEIGKMAESDSKEEAKKE